MKEVNIWNDYIVIGSLILSEKVVICIKILIILILNYMKKYSILHLLNPSEERQDPMTVSKRY